MLASTRRVITGHDQSGKAVVLADGAAPNVKVRKAAGGLVSTLIWVTDETPADIAGAADRADRDIGVPPPDGGSVFRIVDFPPVGDASALDNAAIRSEMGVGVGDRHEGKAANPFMHRTRSVDYGIVLSGSIDMVLDDTTIRLEQGDVVVQQGTNHAWMNRGDTVCRMAFVLIDAVAPPAWGA